MNLSALLGRVELFAATANKLDKSQTRQTESAKTASEKPVRVTRRGCPALPPQLTNGHFGYHFLLSYRNWVCKHLRNKFRGSKVSIA